MRNHKCGTIYGQAICLHRKPWLLLLCFTLIIVLTILGLPRYPESNVDGQSYLEFGTPEFLVDNSECKIPNVLPWNSEFKPFYSPKRPYKCSEKKLLTYIVYEGDQPYLCVNKSLISTYSYMNDVKCCYQTVNRSTLREVADIEIVYSSCRHFEDCQQINATEVVVKCHEKYTKRKIYANVHPVIYKSAYIKSKLTSINKSTEKPPNVLLIGVDSISRLNFQRMLPLTKYYLDTYGWIDYKGYNKVGENTFPNLMALLTGRNMSDIEENCNPYQVGKLDICNYIWKNFSESGYTTAYIEDATHISTFTYLKKGFLRIPTDYYFKPYMTASEDLGRSLLDGMWYCSGPVASGERIFEVVKEFITQLDQLPKFGLFWSNTFSHDNINTPSRMDRYIAEFFQQIQQYLENTIILFFSDHGMRFGDIRQTKTGWYEERLPFAYFWVPRKFRDRFTAQYNNLLRNSYKLTTPYDIYMTMQHIVELYDDKKVRSPYCDGTANCKSLFEDIGDRSCEDLNIPLHYCTCFGYKPFNIRSPLIQQAAVTAVAELNQILQSDVNTSSNCAKYNLGKVTLAQKAIYKNITYILFQLHTVPKAIFEFTMSFNSSSTHIKFKRDDFISRIDKYEETSTCVTTKKLYCYCRSNVQMYMNFFSFWFEV